MTRADERLKRAQEIVAPIDNANGSCEDIVLIREGDIDLTRKRYLLIEKSTHDGSCYITMHGTFKAAAEYHDGNEYEHDWTVGALYDLDSTDSYYGIKTTSFIRRPART